MKSYVSQSPVTLTLVAVAVVTGVAQLVGRDVSQEEAVYGLTAVALVVNTVARNRGRIVSGIRGAKQFMRDVWAAVRS